MEALPERIRRVFPFLPVPKAPVKEKNRGVEGKPKKRKPQMGEFKDNPGRTTPKSSPTARPNHHPTVKPQKLMQYLVTIGSRKGDVVLDPYCGSGTTGVSCMLHGRQFVGIELDPEYVEIAKDRIFGVLGPLFAKVAREESEE
jgi:site-specific DNA-methyltransferase (adenine-specific)